MTEKRLIVRDGDYAWVDTVTDTVIEVEDAFDLVNTLHEENKELKKQREEVFIRERNTKNELRELKHKHSLLHDECLDAECDRDSYQKDVSLLEKENEDLKKLLEAYRKSVADYKYQICKAVDEKLSMVELADNCGIDVE